MSLQSLDLNDGLRHAEHTRFCASSRRCRSPAPTNVRWPRALRPAPQTTLREPMLPELRRIQDLPKEVGVMLITAGIVGLILPGPGTPAVIASSWLLAQCVWEARVVAPPVSSGPPERNEANRSLLERSRKAVSRLHAPLKRTIARTTVAAHAFGP